MERNYQALEKLNNEIARFLQFNKDNLIKRPEWGTISLEEAALDFNRIYDIVNYFKVLPLNMLTIDALNLIASQLNEINSLFDQINNFSIESGNPAQQKSQFVTQLQARADSFYTQASPWIPFLAYQKGDVSKNIESLTESVKQGRELVETAKQDIINEQKEIKEIIVKAREASAAAGAAVFTQDFQQESAQLRKTGKIWLWVTGGLAILTLIIAIIMWYFTEPGLDRGQLWQKIGTKFAILVILISSTIWCGKIYKALMHQASINRHRALSIQTLQAFSAAVADIQVKDAVILEATRTVFGNVPTGYIDSQGGTSEHDIKVLEVVKSILPKAGG